MEAITPEDQKRINACDDYKSTKRIIQSCIDYKDHEVGTAVFIKENFPNSTRRTYVGAGYDNKEPPHKFIIVQNDEGFIFAKRIISTGKPGVEITCLTIRYPSDRYELQVDGDYLDAMLLDSVDEYDPTSSAKELARKKTKASRDNAKNRLLFDNAKDAYNYLCSLKKGDFIWSAGTSYGNEITKYKVAVINKTHLDPKVQTHKSHWMLYETPNIHVSSIKEGLPQGIHVRLEVEESEHNYARAQDLWFFNITRKPQYKDWWSTLYSKKPSKPEDIA